MEPQLLNKQSVKEILLSLGYKLRDDGKTWRTRAVYRNGKNQNSISIFKDTGVWSDFGSDSQPKPFSKLLELHGIKDVNVKASEIQKEDLVEEIDEPQIERTYPESSLKRLLPHYKFYLAKGINVESLVRLKSGMATGGKMYERYVFPIYNKDGKIVGFSGRYMGSLERPKWKHLGKKMNWVYPFYVKDSSGLFFARDAIEKTGEVILVESIGDLLSFHTRGIYNVLVAFGLNISAAMICVILSLNVKKIYLGFNNDENKGEDKDNGKIASIKNFLLLLNYFDYDSIGICPPVKKDFGEMNDIDFERWKEIKATTDYDAQRDQICADAAKYHEMKKIPERAFKNYKLLNCED